MLESPPARPAQGGRRVLAGAAVCGGRHAAGRRPPPGGGAAGAGRRVSLPGAQFEPFHYSLWHDTAVHSVLQTVTWCCTHLCMCLASIVHILTASSARRRLQAVLRGAAAEGRCTAGEEVAVRLQLRDQYGEPGCGM